MLPAFPVAATERVQHHRPLEIAAHRRKALGKLERGRAHQEIAMAACLGEGALLVAERAILIEDCVHDIPMRDCGDGVDMGSRA
jgi:hypothetical protein